MSIHDLLRDNPYRATALPSASSLAEVKAALKRQQVQARAGLAGPQPLESALGRVEAAEAQRLVKELEKNPGLLAAYRLLWPLDATLPAECQTLEQALPFLGTLAGKDLHAGFLVWWFALMRRPDEQTSKSLLICWDRFRSDPVSRARLEETLEPWDVDEGLEVAAGYLAGQALSRGAQEWKAGRHEAALAVFQAALAIHEAAGPPDLSRWVELAEQGLAEIDGRCEAAVRNPSALQNLEPLFQREVRLLQALSPHTAEGPVLMRELHKSADQIGIGLQKQALELIQKRRDLARATQLLESALRLPISAEGREILSRDLAVFQSHLSGSQAPRPQLVGPGAQAIGSSPSATPGSSDSGAGTCLGCLGLVAAFIFFANVGSGSKARNPQETPPPPPPAVSAPAAPTSTYADGLVTEYQALASEIEASRPGLELEQAQLEALRAEADQLEAEIEAARARESNLSSYEIEEANRKIGRYNDLVFQAKNRLTEFNAKVDRHNEKVERAKSLEAELRSLGRIR